MRRGILVVVALGTLLAGCRDFQVPPLGYHGPLKVVPDHLVVAPNQQATLQVEGGTPPYTILRSKTSSASGSGTSGSGTSYLAFPLSAKGSGGFAHLSDTQVDYVAGTGDTAQGKSTADAFVVRDAAGAEVTVDVAIGPPVALTFGSGGAPRSVPAGGTLLLGADGGKGPYLYGLATAASGGSIDAVTGRYHAGPTGCVTDTLLVRDDLGATATAPVNVQCPARLGSPRGATQSRLLSVGGVERVLYFTYRGTTGGDLELPVYGGPPLQVPVPGRVVAATVPPGSSGLVAAVDEGGSIHLFSYGTGTGGTELVDLTVAHPGYPIAQGSQVHLTSGEGLTGFTSQSARATWTTPSGQTFSVLVSLGKSTATPAQVGGQGVPVGSADATVPGSSPTGGSILEYVHLYLPAADGPLEALVDDGNGFGNPIQLPLKLHGLTGVATTDSGDLAILGTQGTAGSGIVPVVTVLRFTTKSGFQVVAGPTVVKAATAPSLIGFGHVRDAGSNDLVVVSQGGGVHLVTYSGNTLTDRATPWFVPPGVRDLFIGDVDGDGLDEILVSGDPEGDRVIEINPSDLPRQSPPSRGVYGQGALDSTAVGTVFVPGARPAILAVDTGHFADGGAAPKGGGEIELIPGGADVGDPIPVKLPLKDGKVVQVVAARLRPNDQGFKENPSDLVAVVETGGTREVWVARFTRPGLPPEVAPLGGKSAPTPFPDAHLSVLPVPDTAPDTKPPRDAVVIVFKGGVEALRWDPSATAVSTTTPIPGTFGWPARDIGDPNRTLLALAQNGQDLNLVRLELDAGGTVLSATEIPDPNWQPPPTGPPPPPPPLVFNPPSGYDLLHARMIAQIRSLTGPVVALVSGGQIVELGTADLSLCLPQLPPVDDLALIREAANGTVLAAALDQQDNLLFTLRLFNFRDAVVDRQVLQGEPTSVSVGKVVGNDDVPDVVVGGTPLTVFPGVPDALLTTRSTLSCH